MGVLEQPVIGHVTVPVRLMGRTNPDKSTYHSGFAHWKIADCLSDVFSETGNKEQIGTIGATMGGHTHMVRYEPHEKAKERTRTQVIVDVRDMWAALEELIHSEEGLKLIAEQVELYPKMQAEAQKKREKKAEIRAQELEKAEIERAKAELEAMESEEAELDKALQND